VTALRSTVPGRGGDPVPLRYALDEVAAGRPVALFDDYAGVQYLVLAADRAAATTVAFAVRHTSGFLCVALTDGRADELQLPALPRVHAREGVPDYAVAIDAAAGISTGISASDRATTIRLLADSETLATDLTRPGHVVPVRTRAEGLLARTGAAEAALDLVRAAGCAPAAVFAHLLEAPPNVPLVTAQSVYRLRRRTTADLRRASSARLPLADGPVISVRYSSRRTGLQHLALIAGEIEPDITVHVHVECVAGDLFGAQSCLCSRRLDNVLAEIAREGRGVVVYVRTGPDDRPHLRTEEHDAVAAEILRDLGVG
jgi:3,4-dihydroxy 2-butanone 4-phosphate synthase / GTP cyclohydrolase II